MKTIMTLTQLPKNEDIPETDEELVDNCGINHISNEKNLNENNSNKQFSPKVCYDNPAFIGITINPNNSNNNLNNNNVIQNNIANNTSLNIGNTNLFSSNKLPASVSPQVTRTAKDRTYSLSSVKSIRSLKNALQTDRRYSRRLSVVQRKYDTPDTPDLPPDDNPLRRKMSFIKDTSGDEEPISRASIQILIASLCAGFGNVGAGVIIDIIQNWRVFIEIKTMFVLVPSLLGLKGNLEMTMASRLSTEANLGHMDSWSKTLKMVGGDMVLVQCQATVISFLAAFVAIGIDLAQTQHFELDKVLVLIASSVLTANVACFLLGLVMAFVIVFSNKINIDPDNIATPIAASLGDVSTAALFALFAEWIYSNCVETSPSLPVLAISTIVLFIFLLPVFYTIARRNSFTHELVHSGWAPVITAMMISSAGGFFLDSAVEKYDKLPPFQPVICGVGGNLVAVAASKISTRLHMNSKLGTLPFGITRISTPFRVFYNERDQSTKLCLILFLMAIPLHFLYSIVIWSIQITRIKITFLLISLYISFATLQVLILLFIGYNLVHLLWSYGINPDMSAIPLLTALGDLLGSVFLLIAFGILEKLNDPNAVISPIIDSMTTQPFNSTDFTTYSNFTF